MTFKVTKLDIKETVYDITVEEDHSFTVGNCKLVVHNCSGQYIGDSVYDFYSGNLEAALLSKNGFGTSGYFGDIHPRGAPITNGGAASGIVPVIRSFVNVARDISQGSQRRGSWASYVPIDHDDFWEVAEYVKNYPDDCNIGWNIPDSFIERLQNGEKEAIARFQRAMKVKMLTGKGYFFFVDRANAMAPQVYKDNNMKIKASNLCCVIKDEFVLTVDGLFSVEKLNLEGYQLTLFDGEKPVSSSEMKLIAKNQPVYEITLENGIRHTVTSDHKVKVIDQVDGVYGSTMWPAINLEKGMEVFIQNKVGFFGKETLITTLKPLSQMTEDDFKLIEKVAVCDKFSQESYVYGTLSVNNISKLSDLLNNPIANLSETRRWRSALFAMAANVGYFKQNTSPVLSVVQKGVEDVYCVHVDTEEHVWTCNGVITSNSEIALPSSGEETFICVLSSMNLKYYDEWKNTDAVFNATVFLDCVNQEFIRLGKDILGLEKSVRFAERHRAIGLGTLGFHTYLQENEIAFEDFQAHMKNIEIYKHIDEQSLRASQWLATELGEPELCKGRGIRNTTRLSIAPNLSSSILAGGVSQG